MSNNLPAITSLFRYPVKSMGGESLVSTQISTNGVIGDRCWAVRDEERGGIRGAKRFAALMDCHARYLEEPQKKGSSAAEIEMPNGQKIMTTDDAVGKVLSDFLGNPVTFWPLIPADQQEHYKRGAPLEEDMEKELRRVFARAPDEPLPDVSAFPPELIEYESLPGTYFDALPILILSNQALATLETVRPESKFDVRRFRPNIVVDATAEDPFPELAWVGKKISIGSAVLSVKLECPRCVMTTHAFSDLPKDPQIMRTLVSETNGNLGVYAEVLESGTISVGDTVSILD